VCREDDHRGAIRTDNLTCPEIIHEIRSGIEEDLEELSTSREKWVYDTITD
jgi:hypothetical protein